MTISWPLWNGRFLCAPLAKPALLAWNHDDGVSSNPCLLLVQ